MQASPFWKMVMRVTGILCLVTLLTPPAFFIKYLIFDRPAEVANATVIPANFAMLPVEFRYVDLFRTRARKAPEPGDRIQAINWLLKLVQSPDAIFTHSPECHSAEDTLAEIGDNDRDPAVRDAAQKAILAIASKGAVIRH